MRSKQRAVLMVCCLMSILTLSGCQTFGLMTGIYPGAGKEIPGTPGKVTRVVPAPGDVLNVDQFMILVDVTESTSENGIFTREKYLLQAFVDAMPDAPYEMGASSFAGVSRSDWMWVPLESGSLATLTDAAANLQYLGHTTPLHDGVLVAGNEFAGKEGRAALLVISDGRTFPHERVLNACAEIANAHRGPVCIYTLNVGFSEPGKDLLMRMAQVTGCGHAWQASDVRTAQGIETMVREIFFVRGPAVRIEQSTMVLLSEVLFDFDKAVLKPEGMAAVDAVIAQIQSRTIDQIVIEGHTCDLGSEHYNLGLSQRRADAVRAYMAEHGIARDRMTTEAYGESRPAVSNTSESNRQLNRRVEFRFSFRN